MCVCIDWSYQSVDGCYYFKSKKKTRVSGVCLCVSWEKNHKEEHVCKKEAKYLFLFAPHSFYLPTAFAAANYASSNLCHCYASFAYNSIDDVLFHILLLSPP